MDEFRTQGLNLDYVTFEYERIGPKEEGMMVQVASNFPQTMSEAQRIALTQDMVEAMVQALIRFETTGRKSYEHSNTLIRGMMIGGDSDFIKYMHQKLEKLNAYLVLDEQIGSPTTFQLIFEAQNIFSPDYEQYLLKEEATFQEISAIKALLEPEAQPVKED